MANTPFGMTGMPGSNPTGMSVATLPSPAGPSTPAVGSSTSPFGSTFPSGTQIPGMTDPMAGATNDPNSFNVASLLGFGQGTNNPLNDITKALRKAGFSAGIAGEIANFLKSGAGFNPAVAQAMIAAMQPGVQRKEADIMEQFSNMGLRSGSPASTALGDFLSQEQLNEGQIWASMYEQSVQNYLNVLLAGKGPAPQNSFQNINQWLNTMANMVHGAGGVQSGGVQGIPIGG